jgi:hypothetical protein
MSNMNIYESKICALAFCRAIADMVIDQNKPPGGRLMNLLLNLTSAVDDILCRMPKLTNDTKKRLGEKIEAFRLQSGLTEKRAVDIAELASFALILVEETYESKRIIDALNLLLEYVGRGRDDYELYQSGARFYDIWVGIQLFGNSE